MPNELVLTPSVLLTSAEVARRLGVCRETVNRAAREGRLLAAMKLPGGPNGAYLFTEDAVVEWRSPGDRLAGL
ncbi:helix-turn-helix domain-containing protein [Leucobacter sp.]